MQAKQSKLLDPVHDFRYPNGMHKSDDLKEPVRDLDNANTTQSSIAYLTSHRNGKRRIPQLLSFFIPTNQINFWCRYPLTMPEPKSVIFISSAQFLKIKIRLLHRLQHALEQADMFAFHFDVYCLYCVLLDPI